MNLETHLPTAPAPVTTHLPAPVSAGEMQQLRQRANSATALLRSLANEDRLLLLCQLSQGEKCVSELEAALDIHQPTLSQQLAVLRAEGLVATRREGRRIFYSVADTRALSLIHHLYQVFCANSSETSHDH